MRRHVYEARALYCECCAWRARQRGQHELAAAYERRAQDWREEAETVESMATINGPRDVEPLTGRWLVFAPDTPEVRARRRFRERFHADPERVERALGLLLVGPVDRLP